MPSRIIATVFDCRDAETLAAFWCTALGLRITRRWRDAHGTEYIESDGDPVLLFHPVSEQKRAKNRVHIDVRAPGPQYDEVARLVALGGRVVTDDETVPWVVMQDPEGNEFCVLPPENA
ncbi:VOC family protein [Actinophytocola sp. NPDC049390]|uniref:VOC family protein n=1 Tax=Actinophytocola sp. NPDC049390 TaxID=3363894 RepID=UPI0037AE7EA5